MLDARSVTKAFFGNTVLQDVDFDIRPGEIHALIGENGAGKSTLLNIVAGIIRRDSGSITLDAREVDFGHPLEAMKAGISMVHQELSLVPNLTVAENIYLRREKTNALGFNDWRAMNRAAADIFARMGIGIEPGALVGSLSLGMQQLVEVAKAIALDAKIIIMDEPTSSLSEKEIAELFRIIRDLKERGLSIVFISHKLSELFEIADRITVLRDGRHIGTRDIGAITPEEIIRMMVGRHLGDLYPRKSSSIGDVIFSCRNVSRFGTVRDLTFDIRRGEILGFAGLVGSGRTEAMRALINADQRSSGRFSLNGEAIEIADPGDALEKGIVYVSEDRKASGLFLAYDIAANVGASTLGRYRTALGMIDQSALRATAVEYIRMMDVRPADVRARAVDLSGGNQQKVLIAKSLDTGPKVLIADEPTRGVDVGAKSLIHSRLRELAEQGVGIVVISSEMPEVIGMSDRILVFRNGAVSAELDNSDGSVTQETVMTHAAHR
jgi:ABC-type sugar transport system ATPase subunit